MSNEWQSLRRCSHLGPKSGLSLSQSQQILRMQELQQKSRRVSLNAKPLNTGLTPDLIPFESSSIENHYSRCQSYCETQENKTLFNSTTTSTKSSKSSKSSDQLNEQQNQSVCDTNCINSVVNRNNDITSDLNSVFSGVTTTSTATTMLPIINFDNVSHRSSVDMSGRMSRRSSRSAQDSFTCSQQSILSAMDRFVKAVINMDSTVLVPSKLRDMDIPSVKLVRIPPALANTDLHSFYLMLNDVKKELLWGPGTQHNTTSLMPFSGRSSPRDLKHIRQPSDDSLGSLGSTASSSSDTDSEADSLMTDRDSVDEHTSHLAAAFRHHLQGLHTILHQLADSADYLSSRYQEDIDCSSI